MNLEAFDLQSEGKRKAKVKCIKWFPSVLIMGLSELDDMLGEKMFFKVLE